MNPSRLIVALLFFVVEWERTNAQWFPYPGLQGRPIHTVVVTDSFIYAGGQMNTLVRSSNYGASWETIAGNIDADTIYALGIQRTFLFASTSRGVYRSATGGTDWGSAIMFPGGFAECFYSYDSVLYSGTLRGIYSTTDAGGTWVNVSSGLGVPPMYRKIIALAFDGRRLFAVADYPGGVFALNGGEAAWVLVGSETMGARTIATVDTNVLVGTGTGVFIYSGQGTAWLARNAGLPESPSVYSLIAFRGVLFAALTSGVYFSTDLGATWRRVDVADSLTSTTYTIAIVNNTLIAGTSAGLWYRSLSDVLSVGGKTSVPNAFSLSQNFPNPFNPTTTIEMNVGATVPVTLKVYDVLGREVATLVEGEKLPGRYSITWNASHLASGVYYYRMTAGSFVETRKLLLLR